MNQQFGPAPANPWGLSFREFQICEALTRLHANKLAALELGIATRTVDEHFVVVKRKMHERTKTGALLCFDRWQREQAK